MRATVVVFVVLCLACGGMGNSRSAMRPHGEFKREFLGASLDEVRAKLGAPDRIDSTRGPFADGYWEYLTAVEDRKVSLHHKDGRVVAIY